MYEDTVKGLRIYADCENYFKKHNDCFACPMPYKTEPGKVYQKECVDFEKKWATLAADAIETLLARAEKAEAERDAAVADLQLSGNDPFHCGICKNQNDREKCKDLPDGSCTFEWRGKDA